MNFSYRLAVLKALPNLEKLDDKMVTQEEVQKALILGRLLVHPLNQQKNTGFPLSDQENSKVSYFSNC